MRFQRAAAAALLSLAAIAAGAQGAFEEAVNVLEDARRAVRLDPENAAAQRALATALLRLGRLEPALEALARCRDNAPREPACYLLAGVALRDSERVTEAVEMLAEGWRETGGVELAEELGFLLLAQGQPARALEVIDAALAADPGDGDLELAKALALSTGASSAGTEPSEADSWFERALEHGVAKSGEARLEWARSLADRGRWSDAAEQLALAAEDLADNAEVRFRLATALRQVGDEEGAADALAAYERLSKAQNEAVRRHRELGTALNEAQQLASENRLAEAWERLDGVGDDGDAEPRFWTLRAKLLYADGRVDDARLAAGKAASLDPSGAEPMYLLALFAFVGERFEESAAASRYLVALEPSFGEGWALHGSAQARLDQPDEAAAAFERALATGFDSVALRREYAGILALLGRTEESREQLEALSTMVKGEGEGSGG